MGRETERVGDQTTLGIAIILVSVLMMAFADALVKLISDDLTIWQIFFARSLFGVPILLFLARARKVNLIFREPRWVLARTLCLLLCWVALYASFTVLSLSVAAVAVYANPIITTLLSAALIDERVTRRQWVGVLLGFLGVIAIIRPGTESFSSFVILPLVAAALYSTAMIITRSKCQNDAPLALSLALLGCFLVAGMIAIAALAIIDLGADTKSAFPFLLGDWVPIGVREWSLMALLGVLAATYFMGVARAYQIAPPQIIGTFDYGYLLFAAFWGYLFFLEIPDLPTVGGMVLVTLAGLLVVASSSGKAGVKTLG